MQMNPQARATACTKLNRVIDQLSAWDRHLRNPAKYSRPAAIYVAKIRLEALAHLDDWQPDATAPMDTD